MLNKESKHFFWCYFALQSQRRIQPIQNKENETTNICFVVASMVGCRKKCDCKYLSNNIKANESLKPEVPKLGAARTCESCCIYSFSDKNCNVKVVSSFLQFYSVW